MSTKSGGKDNSEPVILEDGYRLRPAIEGEGDSWAALVERSMVKRSDKNILEVVLEKDVKGSFVVGDLDCAKFLRKIGLDMRPDGPVDGVQICPNGRGVLYITLKDHEDLNKYCRYDVLEITASGIRSVMVKPACKRDVVLTFKGIHPNTRDSDVFEYLEKYGSLVTKRVIYGVFADGPLKGIKNGDRSYKLEIRPKTNIGSYHLIDGHRVQLRYPGQQQTCGRCFQVSSGCIGKGVARRCEAAGGAKKDFKVYIAELWSKIGYNPNIEVNGSDSEDDLDSEVNKQIGGTFTPIKSAESLPYAFAGVTIRQIPSDIDHGEVMEFLFEAGLPEIKADYVTIKDNVTVIIKDIENEVCVELIRNIHGKMGFSKKLFCNGIVPMTLINQLKQPLFLNRMVRSRFFPRLILSQLSMIKLVYLTFSALCQDLHLSQTMVHMI